MLVLSRRPSEKLLFPALHTTIEVLTIRPKVVRLGIEAPDDLTVLRGELRPRAGGRSTAGLHAAAGLDHTRHLVRDRLNNLLLGIALLRRQLQAGSGVGALDTLEKLDAELEAFREQFDSLGDDVSQLVPPSQMTGPARR